MERHLARAHPITPILWFGPVMVLALYRAIVAQPRERAIALLIFAVGWLAWSLLEYVLHRFVFHMGARNSNERLRAFLLHGYHHEFPDDRSRLVAPPVMSWPIGATVGIVLYFAIGDPYWLPCFAGMAAGYVAYDWIHYYTHHFRPKKGVGKWLRSYHMLHHFDDRETRFGVSSPLWDFVFGTYRPVPQRRVVSMVGRKPVKWKTVRAR